MVRRLNQFLAVLVSLGIALLIFEGILRILGWAPLPRMHRFDPVVGWVKSPGADIRRATAEFDVRVRTNERGLRGPEAWSYERQSDELRILMVGDSFTLGYTVPEEETIPFLLAAELGARGVAAEVLNAGTEGWSTDQEVLWLATEGRRYDPDIVILQMYENDIFWNAQDRYLRYPKPMIPQQGQAPWLPEEVAEGAALVDPGTQPWILRETAVGRLVNSLASGPVVPMLEGRPELPAEWGVRLAGNEVGRGETRAALRAFGRTANGMDAEGLVLIIPDKAQVDAEAARRMREFMNSEDYRPGRPYDFLVLAAREAGLRVVGGLAALRREQERGPVYFARDWHTNDAGNRALAAALAQRLLGSEFPAIVATGAASGLRLAKGKAEAETTSLVPAGLFAGLALWALLGTLFLRRFPEAGWSGSYVPVGLLLAFVAVIYAAGSWLVGWLPPWAQALIPPVLLGAFLVLAGYYLRGRLLVMAELLFTFVRRGHWYMLPVIVALLSVGGLLVVAASSPWLAPFIYTLF